jgi:uncharacterized UBP type Zn finger protein
MNDVNKLFPGTPVHKEECCYCFQSVTCHLSPNSTSESSIVSPLVSTKLNYPKGGHNICLTCFTGACLTPFGHFFRHYEVTKHHVLLNITTKPAEITAESTSSSVCTKDALANVKSLSQLAELQIGSEAQKNVQKVYSAYCVSCDITIPVTIENTPKLYESLQAVINADNGLKLQELSDDMLKGGNAGSSSGFDEQAFECEHVHTISDTQEEQSAMNLSIIDNSDESNRPFFPYSGLNGDKVEPLRIYTNESTFLPDLSTATTPLQPKDCQNFDQKYGKNCYNKYQCQDCAISTNLWMCMTCGYLGCARRDYDGSGGNNHAIEHNKQTGHEVVIKIATVSKDKGDLWCYKCEGSAIDSKLKTHLGLFNLDPEKMLQTESTLSDLQLELNITAQFASAYNKDGYSRPLLFGPLYTGVQNFGNSCYMSAIMQLYLRIPNVFSRYFIQGKTHVRNCRNGRPGTCILCNMWKVTSGLFSGDFSHVPNGDVLVKFIGKVFPSLQNSKLLQQLTHHDQNVMGEVVINTTKQNSDNNNVGKRCSAEMMNDGDYNDCSVGNHKKQRQNDDRIDDKTEQHKNNESIGSDLVLQNGITIHSLRKLLNNNHPVFGNLKQQDAHEFFGHFRDFLQSFEKKEEEKLKNSASQEEINNFVGINDGLAFKTQQTINCTNCGVTTYKYSQQYDLDVNMDVPVEIIDENDNVENKEEKKENEKKYESQNFSKCLSNISKPSELIGYRCDSCQVISKCISTTNLFTLPQFLTVQVKRFIIDTNTWTFTKNNAPLKFTEQIDVSPILSTIAPDLISLKKQEENKQKNGKNKNSSGNTMGDDDEKYYENAQLLQDMIMAPRCIAVQCLKKCGNNPDMAVEIYFGLEDTSCKPGCGCPSESDGNMDNDGDDQNVQVQVVDPITIPAGKLDLSPFDQVTRAYHNTTPTGYKLVGFVNHLGTGAQNGHYVTHINTKFNQFLSQIEQQDDKIEKKYVPTVFSPLSYDKCDLPTTFNDIQACLTPLSEQQEQWVCYNDAKVFVNDEPPNDQAYILLYQRIE